MRVAVIINPISGAAGRPDAGRRRAELAGGVLAEHGVAAEVIVTDRAGVAPELARGAVSRGATLVVAWGGDGTVNEVGGALAYGPAALGIVPAGSGNGLARELGIDPRPAEALAAAVHGRPRVIDAGELDGRLFFNLAGIGFDAVVAARFNARARGRRGFLPYLAIAAREIASYVPDTYILTAGGEHDASRRHEALLIVVANGRQYGNGATIAPFARIDDGRLDLVVVERRSPLAVLMQMPYLFRGRLAELPGVTLGTIERVTITARRPMPFHVDGETGIASSSLTVRVRPGALTVKC